MVGQSISFVVHLSSFDLKDLRLFLQPWNMFEFGMFQVAAGHVTEFQIRIN